MSNPRTRKEREVWHAITTLRANGLDISDVTGEILGERLLELGYNRGSNADIYRYKRSWVAAHDQADNAVFVEGFQLSDPISKAANILREKIDAEAKVEIENIKIDLLAQIDELQSQCAKLHEALDTEKTKNLRLEVKNDLQAKENQDLQAQLQKADSVLVIEKTKAAGLQDKYSNAVEQYKAEIFNLCNITEECQKQITTIEQISKNEIDAYKTALEDQRQQNMIDKEILVDVNKKLTERIEILTRAETKLNETLEYTQESFNDCKQHTIELEQQLSSINVSHGIKVDALENSIKFLEADLAVSKVNDMNKTALVESYKGQIADLQKLLMKLSELKSDTEIASTTDD